MKRIYYATSRPLGYRSFSRIDGPDVVELKRMLHALGYWRPTLAAFPNAPNGTSNQKLAELRKTDPAAADKLQAESRRIQQEYTRDFALYDEEAPGGRRQVPRRQRAQLPGQSRGPGRSAHGRRAARGVLRQAKAALK